MIVYRYQKTHKSLSVITSDEYLNSQGFINFERTFLYNHHYDLTRDVIFLIDKEPNTTLSNKKTWFDLKQEILPDIRELKINQLI